MKSQWRAKGLWTGVFAEPDPGLHTEAANPGHSARRTTAAYKRPPVQPAAKADAGEPV